MLTDFLLTTPLAATPLPTMIERQRAAAIRTDNWVTLVVIAIALVLIVGLATAWWITCQRKGMYPALDMPSWNSGGTWKAYCRA